MKFIQCLFKKTKTQPDRQVRKSDISYRISADEAYMQMAEVWATRSYATRLKVGALLVKDLQIISDGFNGLPSGIPNCQVELLDTEGKLYTNSLVLHAESNAIAKCARNRSASSEGSTLYVTHSPCSECCKFIIQAGIKRVVFRKFYRNTEAIEILKQVGISVEQLESPK